MGRLAEGPEEDQDGNIYVSVVCVYRVLVKVPLTICVHLCSWLCVYCVCVLCVCICVCMYSG